MYIDFKKQQNSPPKTYMHVYALAPAMAKMALVLGCWAVRSNN